jgi:Xaa-Pro aminopeptidase
MFESEIYIARRRKLREKIGKGVLLFPGNSESPMNYADNAFRFRQDSSFLYLFGLDIPYLSALIDAETGEEILFGNDFSIDDIIWMGPQVPLSEKAEKAGIKKVEKTEKLSSYIEQAIASGRKVHFLPPYRHETMLFINELLGISASKQKSWSSVELVRALVDLRSVKDPNEIGEIRKAAAIGYQMHVTAMKMAKEGTMEHTIAGVIEGIALSGGGMSAFPIILSQNGETLHNHDHSQVLKKGRLMLVDAGAEVASHYACDFTRTTPVGGRFTSKQREIYEIVLAANNHGRELTRPGIPYLTVHLEACEVIAAGLKELGVMKGDVKEAVQKGAHALFMPHGFGHMLGLDAHDMENLGEQYVGYDDEIHRIRQFGTSSVRLGRRLQPGFVITNEPGIYFIPALIEKWKSAKMHTDFINYDRLDEYLGFGGIRLEDNILVTETGCEIIGERVPINPEEVENLAG